MSEKTEVSTTGGGLPAEISDSMATALMQSAAMAGVDGGELYMKYTKFGEWVYGAEDTEVEEGSVWAINPRGMQHGWIAWGREGTPQEGKNLGEVLAPSTDPYPLQEKLPDVLGEWSKCVAIQLRCTNGEDEGTQVLFKTNSRGGRKAYGAVMAAIFNHLKEDRSTPVPLVTLHQDSYEHPTFGKIMEPLVKVEGWTTMSGETQVATEAAEETPEEAPVEKAPEEERPRRRKRAAS